VNVEVRAAGERVERRSLAAGRGAFEPGVCVDDGPSGAQRNTAWRVRACHQGCRRTSTARAGTTAEQRQLSDLLLQPALASVDLLDWRAFDQAVEIGYRCAATQLAGGALRGLV
jgi:hypothetical protein